MIGNHLGLEIPCPIHRAPSFYPRRPEETFHVTTSTFATYDPTMSPIPAIQASKHASRQCHAIRAVARLQIKLYQFQILNVSLFLYSPDNKQN